MNLFCTVIRRNNPMSSFRMKTTIQILYDKGIYDNIENADDVLKEGLLFEDNERRSFDSKEKNDDVVIHWFYW